MLGEPAEIQVRGFVWDEETIEHLANHDVTIADVLAVHNGAPRYFVNEPRHDRTGSHAMIGCDDKDRALFVVLVESSEEGYWWPVTGYESRVVRKILNEERGSS